MASPTNKQEYRVRDLPTRAVTLFASRAQVVREIKDVPLKPGLNEITIVGLTPSVDEHSIKVEGTGSAIITDIAVESLPNREIFEDVYPESEDDSESESESEPDDGDYEPITREDVPESDDLKAVRAKLLDLANQRKRADETISNAQSRIKYLDKYYDSLTGPNGSPRSSTKETKPVDIGDAMTTYDTERAKVFEAHLEGKQLERDIDTKVKDLQKMEKLLLKEHDKLVNEKQKQRAKVLKKKEKERKLKEKEKQKVRRQKEERAKEKLRIRRERESFWPKTCFTVRIKLDAVNFTPMSSRRSSVVTVEAVKPVPEKTDGDGDVATATPGLCDLSLSYVTSYAYWSPKYDLQLSTTNNTGVLCFDAELTNMTSETWSDCKVTLSTSQTTTSSLTETIPTLMPWHVKLGGRYAALGNVGGPIGDILDSREERNHKTDWKQRNTSTQAQKPRSDMFGKTPNNVAIERQLLAPIQAMKQQQMMQQVQIGGVTLAAPQQQQILGGGAFGNAPVRSSLFGSTSNSAPFAQPGPTVPTSGGLFGASAGTRPGAVVGGLFGAQNNAAMSNTEPVQSDEANTSSGWNSNMIHGSAPLGSSAAPASAPGTRFNQKAKKRSESQTRSGYFGSMRRDRDGGGSASQDEEDEDEDMAAELPFDEMTLNPTKELDFAESSFEETGLTTTYDLPGLKTLAPSPTASKQRVARIQFSNVAFSHTVVAKYRPAAYLKAKLRNSSKITLLKGATGLTLDGSFMGRTSLPRCSAGETFTLPLGIDPAIRVAYPKPDVHRATTGFFGKEDTSVYTRSITLANTRASAGKAVNLLVLDQVPVSEDEKLRIELQQPRGMSAGGAAVATGVGLKDGTGKPGEWGSAKAQLKKDGQVCWEVSLNAGRSTKLTLEYEVALPVGEKVVQC